MSGLLIIANPKARQDPQFDAALKAFESEGGKASVRIANTPEDTAKFLTRISDLDPEEAPDTLVAAGGDGTLNAVFGTAFKMGLHERLTLGILPLGTANDFASAAGIPQNDLETALEIAAHGQVHTIDLGLKGDEPFLNALTGGFGAQVTVETDPGLKRQLGGLAYIVSGLARMGEVTHHEGRFTGENFSWEGRFLAVAVANGQRAGGGIPVCPDARIDDGLIDLVIIPDFTDRIGLPDLENLFNRDDEVDALIIRSRGSWFEFISEKELHLNRDGEPGMENRFRAECRAGALQMRLPAHNTLVG